MSMNKKTKAALAGGGALAMLGVAGGAYAAALTLQSNQLGAGTQTVASCADNTGATLRATWTPNLAAAATTGVTDTKDGFVVKSVNITGIPAACTGKTIYVSVHNGTSVLGNGSFDILSSTTAVPSVTVPLTTTLTTGILAKDLTGINVLIPN